MARKLRVDTDAMTKRVFGVDTAMPRNGKRGRKSVIVEDELLDNHNDLAEFIKKLGIESLFLKN
ncbi:MAG: hypothetical protein A2297_08325 [Elusimicrobia bacterium RIFOXYB2_FULL_48_7]|nr:MAG: hypothetical protein A2297_08325 [Elusimicrobia bacterium RIFOXYB2_FULL_48_7]